MRKNIFYVLLVALAFGEGLRGGAAQSQQSSVQQEAVERNWKLTPADPAPEPTNEKERARRHARGAMFDDPTGKKPRLGMDNPDEGKIIRGASAPFPMTLPPLPAAESDTIVVGTLTSFQAYFSNDRTSIYHELLVRVEQVLKDKSSIAARDGSFTIPGGGGSLRLSNGKAATEFIPPQVQNDVRVGRRYVLFLQYRPQEESFVVLKGWELFEGRAIPMALSDVMDAKSGSSRYAGMEEAGFLNAVRDSVANSEKGHQ